MRVDLRTTILIFKLQHINALVKGLGLFSLSMQGSLVYKLKKSQEDSRNWNPASLVLFFYSTSCVSFTGD